MCISKSKQCYNAKHSAYHFYVKTKILVDFQFFFDIPKGWPFANLGIGTSALELEMELESELLLQAPLFPVP